MAGRPVLRNQLKYLEGLGPEGEEQVLSWIAEGSTVKQVATKLGFPPNSLTALYKWRDKTPVRKEAWHEAMRMRANTLADDTLEIADDALPDVDELRKAEIRIRVRQHLAAVGDPDRYGKNQQIKISGQVEHFHLTAVKEANAAIQAAAIEKLRLSAGSPAPLLAALSSADEDADYTFRSYDDRDDDDELRGLL